MIKRVKSWFFDKLPPWGPLPKRVGGFCRRDLVNWPTLILGDGKEREERKDSAATVQWEA